MTGPTISIIIANYNYARFIARSVRSCLEQHTMIPYEVLIVDDGSTDDSLDVIRPLLEPRIRLIEMANGGIEAASNAGLLNALGEFVVRVDADDYLLPDFIDALVSALQGSEHAFAYPDYLVVGPSDELLYEDKLPDFDAAEIMARGDVLPTGMMYRKAVVRELGGYDESTKNCGLENYEIVLKLLRAGHTGLHIPRPLFAYRRHGLNMSTTKAEAIISYGRQLFDRLGLGPYRTNEHHPFRLVVGDQ
jgi:glycosyltransferase involved in cell wall biosynthesis